MYKKRLLEIGIPADIKGFEYLNYAICQYISGQSIIELYKQVAQNFDTTPSRAERAMRHAVQKTKNHGTVGQFIAKHKILWED